MASRMERYYQATEPEETEPTKRTRANEELYNTIYSEIGYSNIEGIAEIEKTNEIDITRIKEMLKNRENFRREKELRQIVKESVTPIVEEVIVEEDKNYDIRDILSKAKDERDETSETNDYRSLKNTQYNILKGISLQEHMNKKEYLGEDDEDLKGLINTITNTSMLNKLGDRELSLNMFGDLRSSGDTIIGQTDPIRKILESGNEPAVENHTLDKSFYTSSLNFNEQDFEGLKDMSTALKKNNFLIKLLIFTIAVIITSAIGFAVFIYLK